MYRARDTRLKRDVALKILPQLWADDPDRLARFQREAEVLATLNHPHIAAIYGLEDANGSHALVMELVEGEDLSQRLERGPIPLDESLTIARQIAEALEAAHESGVIHRDLKPANIKVRPDGTVKVLDFGLAKLAERDNAASTLETLAHSPTITSPAMMTHAGVILGTAAYMSPEQARGRAADRRADIWAFGAILFEMLTGQRPFKGDTISDTLASVLKTDPTGAWCVPTCHRRFAGWSGPASRKIHVAGSRQSATHACRSNRRWPAHQTISIPTPMCRLAHEGAPHCRGWRAVVSPPRRWRCCSCGVPGSTHRRRRLCVLARNGRGPVRPYPCVGRWGDHLARWHARRVRRRD